MTLQDWLSASQTRLTEADIWSARLDAELIAAHVLDHPREWLLAHPETILTTAQLNDLTQLVNRRADHHPLVHLTGHREFFGLDFEITPDVLTPRPESESMIEWAIRYAPSKSRLIDIGTGSGAIAIAIASRRPDLQVVCTDVTPEALEIAGRNAARHKVQLELIQSDLWQQIRGRFSTIVTNLPYLPDNEEVTTEVKREPAIALFGGPDGLDLYRRFLEDLPNHLEPGGFLFTECDRWQHPPLQKQAAKYGLLPIEEDYFIMGFQHEPAK